MHSGFCRRTLFLLTAALLFLFLHGCSTKYTIISPEYDRYGGEVNQHTRLIHAERNKIFQILTREETLQGICPKGTIVTFEHPLPYQVGTLIITKINHIFKLEWRSRVEEIIPDTKSRVQFLDGFFAGGAEIWGLKDMGGETRVTHTIVVKPRGFIRKMFWNLKVRLKHNKMVEAFLDNLKRAAEAK
jgi:carbon monoxide dehydrogenase subunit G